MKNDLSNFREDVQILLSDIYDFLSNEINEDKLSSQKLNAREKLIKRIKTQLNQLSKLSTYDLDLPSYVDMTHKKEDASEYVYSDFNDVQVIESDEEINKLKLENIEKKQPECPHIGLPAKNIPKGEKCGQLERREKLLLLWHQNKLFAGIYGEWLLLYYNEKDTKPFETYYLKLFDAKEVKKENCFTLVPKDDPSNYKTQFFTALSQKDAGQWISKINKISTSSFCASVAKQNVDSFRNSNTDIQNVSAPTSPEPCATSTNFVNDLKVHMGRFSSVQNDNNYDLVEVGASPRHSNVYCQIAENENVYDVVTALPTEREYDVIQSPDLPEKEKTYDLINPPTPSKKKGLLSSFRRKRKPSK